MEYINWEQLQANKETLKKDWNSKKPFRYICFENFFYNDKAERILQTYPNVAEGTWDGTTYIHQKNKFQQSKFASGSIFQSVFNELNSQQFLDYLSELTGIEKLVADDKLFGGGLHQSITGAFLNVHVDYNFHPETKYHRRLNVLVYMNKDWKDEYEGHLQLWDMDKKVMLEKIAPQFNRMVMFETNEISFHGHPDPLKTPHGISRKSLATYYYTADRSADEIAGDHNTLYVNTQGVSGKLKTVKSGIKALLERLFK
jgi:Rps23 Pro-64 3,4-dihydroxylase Tpa1-like proline 4-hydroxylase